MEVTPSAGGELMDIEFPNVHKDREIMAIHTCSNSAQEDKIAKCMIVLHLQ